MSEFEQNSVSKVIWPWKEQESGPANGKGMPHWVRALIQTAVMVVIASILYFWAKHQLMGTIVYSLAGIVLVSGLIVPPVFNAIERFGKALGHYVATGLTWVLLVPFFYIVFAPAHALQRMRGKDPLCRSCPTQEKTYWIPRPPVTDVSHFRKQH